MKTSSAIILIAACFSTATVSAHHHHSGSRHRVSNPPMIPRPVPFNGALPARSDELYARHYMSAYPQQYSPHFYPMTAREYGDLFSREVSDYLYARGPPDLTPPSPLPGAPIPVDPSQLPNGPPIISGGPPIVSALVIGGANSGKSNRKSKGSKSHKSKSSKHHKSKRDLVVELVTRALFNDDNLFARADEPTHLPHYNLGPSVYHSARELVAHAHLGPGIAAGPRPHFATY